MNQNILITTSDNIPYSQIENHLGLVDSQIVVGANLFSDVFAGFRDLFGGEVKGYKKEISKMKLAALSEIKSEAIEKGANAILCLKMDLDEVSGANKSMFMISVYGSAVKLKDSVLKNSTDFKIDELSSEEINIAKKRNQLKSKLKQEGNISDTVYLEKIVEYNVWDKEISKLVLQELDSSNNYRSEEFTEKIIKAIPIEHIENYLYVNFPNIKKQLWNSVITVLKNRNWFNYNFLIKHLDKQNHITRYRALQLCTLSKDTYSKNDVVKISSLSDFISKEFDSDIPLKEVSSLVRNYKIKICPHCLSQRKPNNDRCECSANSYGLVPYSLTPEKIAIDLKETAIAIEDSFKKYLG